MPSKAAHTIHARHHHFGWDNSFPPVARVAPGATLEFECVDASGGQLSATSTLADVAAIDFGRVNPVNGPIYVEGAKPGDTLKVNCKVVDVTYDEKAKQNRTRERLQAFEGVCIGRQGAGINESFTVRKISYGEGVERVFPIYSPLVDSVEVVRRGKVRRAKLYYLRGRRGKAARITERQRGDDMGEEAPAS